MKGLLAPSWTDIWPEVLVKAKSLHAVHLGSGNSKLENFVNVDINPNVNPDVQCDLNKYPLPFEENTFDMVVAMSIIEHLDDFLGIMGEIHRISKNGASVYILVPHFSSSAAYIDPTHHQHLSARSCDYFLVNEGLERDYGFYVPYRYRLVRRYVSLASKFFTYCCLLPRLIAKYPAFWEDHLCFVIRGGGVFWHLQVVK